MNAESVWLVDPIDGTKSFVRDCPFFSTQIALMRGGRFVFGVSSAPAYDELAWAETRRWRVSQWQADSGEQGGRARRRHRFHRQPEDARGVAGLGALRRTDRRISRIRGYGDFVHYHLLARGALDVVIESDVNILDIAALTVIVEEAGGNSRISRARPVNLDTTTVLATNGALHETILDSAALRELEGVGFPALGNLRNHRFRCADVRL